MRMKHARTILGMGVMVVLPMAGTLLLPDLGNSTAWSVVQSVLELFLGALAGAWVARAPFVVPALVVWALLWGAFTWLLHAIGAPAGSGSVAAILQYNWLAIALSGAGAVAGALCGQVLSRTRAA